MIGLFILQSFNYDCYDVYCYNVLILLSTYVSLIINQSYILCVSFDLS